MKSLKRQLVFFLSLVFLMTSMGPVVPAFAQNTEVPLYIKYRYEKLTGRKWYDASPERQREFIDQMKKERTKRRQAEQRKESMQKFEDAQKKHAQSIRKLRRKLLADARKRRKQDKERKDRMRKQQLKAKRAEMSRRIQARKASNR